MKSTMPDFQKYLPEDRTKLKVKILSTIIINADSDSIAATKFADHQMNFVQSRRSPEHYRTILLRSFSPGFYYGIITEYDSFKVGFFEQLVHQFRIFIATALGYGNCWFPVGLIERDLR